MPPLLVLDSATLYYRSFYALPESMTAPDGHPHNAIRGFLQTLARLITRFDPRGVVAAWDADWRPQWRVDLVPTYKTHRLAKEEELVEEVPDTLSPQIGAIAEILAAWGVPVVGVEDHEADDVIGSLAAATPDVLVVTSDRDLLQVVSPTVSLLQMRPGGMDTWTLLDPQAVRARYGVFPESYVDFAVLRGDPSDGLPGVRGIGEKTAVALIDAFGSLDGVLDATAHPQRPMTPRLASVLDESRDYIARAREVVAVRRDLDVSGAREYLPDMVHDPLTLRELSAEWGVGRFVDEALSAAHTVLE